MGSDPITLCYLALAVALVGCDAGSSCEVLERHVGGITSAVDEAVTRRSGSGQFAPVFDDFAKTVGERCRKRELADESVACLRAARTGIEIDRCAAQHRL